MIHPNPVAIMVVGSGQESLLRGPNGPTELAARRLGSDTYLFSGDRERLLDDIDRQLR